MGNPDKDGDDTAHVEGRVESDMESILSAMRELQSAALSVFKISVGNPSAPHISVASNELNAARVNITQLLASVLKLQEQSVPLRSLGWKKSLLDRLSECGITHLQELLLHTEQSLLEADEKVGHKNDFLMKVRRGLGDLGMRLPEDTGDEYGYEESGIFPYK